MNVSARSAADEPKCVLERLPLRGAGGEPVDFRATLRSHGLGWLAPNTVDEAGRTFETTLAFEGRARVLRVWEDPPGSLALAASGRAPGAKLRAGLVAAVRTIFSLDDDLAPFYARVAADRELRFATGGFGRLLRSPSAFEEVVRTICTTNCAWSATTRMIEALVGSLGTRASGVPQAGWRGRAFPTAAQVASADESFFRDVARAGYRGAYL
ncbi:MAG: hypothetical protein WAN59_04875, partial [Candidatus Baltobacteraceae bacterium]